MDAGSINLWLGLSCILIGFLLLALIQVYLRTIRLNYIPPCPHCAYKTTGWTRTGETRIKKETAHNPTENRTLEWEIEEHQFQCKACGELYWSPAKLDQFPIVDEERKNSEKPAESDEEDR